MKLFAKIISNCYETNLCFNAALSDVRNLLNMLRYILEVIIMQIIHIYVVIIAHIIQIYAVPNMFVYIW